MLNPCVLLFFIFTAIPYYIFQLLQKYMKFSNYPQRDIKKVRANASKFLEFHIALLILGYLNKLWDGEPKEG